MRVDAYTATVAAPAEEVIDFLLAALPERERLQVGKDGAVNRWKYDHGLAIFDGRSAVAGVRWGGNGGKTNIELKGSVAPDTFGLIRAHYPDHGCTRLDVALDLAAPGLFDDTLAKLRAIAHGSNPRIAMTPDGDWEYGEKGRTMYFGSRESQTRVVLYEKGLELAAKSGLAAHFFDRNHVRLELRLKPDKASEKALLASLAPEASWGWSPWAAKALEAFTGLSAVRVELPARETDDERTWRALVAQYGRFLDRQADGHWHNITARLRTQCEGLDTRRRRAA